MKLSDLPKKHNAIITKIKLEQSEITDRLFDFGLQVGQDVSCVETSPLGGPKAYRLSHGVFALDHEIAHNVEVSQEAPS